MRKNGRSSARGRKLTIDCTNDDDPPSPYK
jgi:hypothetical protein